MYRFCLVCVCVCVHVCPFVCPGPGICPGLSVPPSPPTYASPLSPAAGCAIQPWADSSLGCFGCRITVWTVPRNSVVALPESIPSVMRLQNSSSACAFDNRWVVRPTVACSKQCPVCVSSIFTAWVVRLQRTFQRVAFSVDFRVFCFYSCHFSALLNSCMSYFSECEQSIWWYYRTFLVNISSTQYDLTLCGVRCLQLHLAFVLSSSWLLN